MKQSLFLLTKSIKALPAFISVWLVLAASTSVTQAGIIDSVTEDINQARSSLGEGGSGCRKIENTSSPVRAGQQAFRHLVELCGERAELETKHTQIGETYWYGWSMFIPPDWKDSSQGYDLINQWASYPVAPNREFACGAVGSYMIVTRNSINFKLQRQGETTDSKCDEFPMVSVADARGEWVDFVMQAKWTGNTDGFVKLWRKIGNGDYLQKVDYKGRTFWNNEDRGPYFKMGVYKGDPDFKGPAPRMLYTDEYRLGDANSDFQDVAPGGLSKPPLPISSIRVEAEQMDLSIYKVVANSSASGGKMVSLPNASSSSGIVSSTFSGSSGVYDVVIGYFDENDGEANLEIKRQGTLLGSLDLNQNLGGSGPNNQTLVRKQVVSGVSLNYGDKIEIKGTANLYEWARVDYIDFVSVP